MAFSKKHIKIYFPLLVVSEIIAFFAALKNEPQTDRVMSKVCQLTGKQAMSGNNVSFSNRKTKRRFSPNLITKKFFIPEENAWISIRLSTSALKTINKIGISEALKRMEKKGRL